MSVSTNTAPVDPSAPAKARRVVPSPTLHVAAGPTAGTTIRLETGGTLGRRDDNTYCLDHPSVSRVHAEITRQAGAVIVTDLGSSGGTRVNGEPITRSALNHGDRIVFGALECVFEDPVAASVPENATVVLTVPEIETGPNLSPRQQEVLELMADGLTNKEIGDRLGITERTVKAYAQELYDKLDVRNRAGAVAAAIKHDLLPDLM
jgi:DNA-binding CsgD family transcriptional regulator